jgi:hypothetical protein
MRLFIYAMESSGASTFCYVLGQRPGSVAVVDVWSRIRTPLIGSGGAPIVAKATVTTIWTAADHIASFRPDHTILFVRDPVAVYASLSQYPYANTFGTIEEKMARLDAEYGDGRWDAVIRYEDFVRRDPAVIARVNELGWVCDAGYWDTPRSFAELAAFNNGASVWCRGQFGKGWGFGNIKPGPVNQAFSVRPDLPEIAARVAAVSPRLSAAYGDGRA